MQAAMQTTQKAFSKLLSEAHFQLNEISKFSNLLAYSAH